VGYLDEYDGIILGAGHNGLIAQAYLARAGLKILSIERAQHAGGGLTTAEDNAIPGLYHATHAVSFRGITTTPWYLDLELSRWDVELLEPDPTITSITSDGRSICWYRDVDKTAKSIEAFSSADAGTWCTIAADYRELTQRLVGPEPPSPEDAPASILSRTALGRKYLDLLKLSPRQFVEDTFQTPALKAMLLYLCVVREVDINAGGQGHLIPSCIASTRPGQIVRGGSYALARGLKHDIYAHGGHIMEQTEPRRILVTNGRAAGVELLDGRMIHAGFVVSTLDPHQTFRRLLAGEAISGEPSGMVEDHRHQGVGPIFGVNIATRDAPRYRAAEANPDVDDTWLVFLGLDDPAPVYQLYRDADAGRLPEQVMLIGGCPTQRDPTQAPSGQHAAFMWQKVPYNLGGSPPGWDRQKPRQLQAILDAWARHAPNVRGDNLLNAFASSPLDTERRYPGWFGPGQRSVDQPHPCGKPYRAIEPDRLYLCGSSTHPGGDITGNPGYIAAGEILGDLGIDPWWTPRDIWSDRRHSDAVIPRPRTARAGDRRSPGLVAWS
jgi:phytoene dehydrogenase-like protein